MNDTNLTDDELIRAVDNDPGATPRERELAQRLDTATHPEEPEDKEGWCVPHG